MNLERRAVDLVASLAPWFTPLPTAWLVYDRAMRYLAWPQAVAAVAGLTLELLGVGILATWLMLYGYNRDKRQSDPAAVMWLPVLLVILYFLAAEALTVVLDVWPAMATIAPALFPVLSVAAFALLALRANHVRRLDMIEAGKAEARERRKQSKQEKEKPPEDPEKILYHRAMEVAQDKKSQILYLIRTEPNLTQADIARILGASQGYVSTIARDGRKKNLVLDKSADL